MLGKISRTVQPPLIMELSTSTAFLIKSDICMYVQGKTCTTYLIMKHPIYCTQMNYFFYKYDSEKSISKIYKKQNSLLYKIFKKIIHTKLLKYAPNRKLPFNILYKDLKINFDPHSISKINKFKIYIYNVISGTNTQFSQTNTLKKKNFRQSNSICHRVFFLIFKSQ